MDHLRHQKYENKQLNITWVLKVRNSCLELENDIYICIYIPINDMDIFWKKKELTKKKTFTEHT